MNNDDQSVGENIELHVSFDTDLSSLLGDSSAPFFTKSKLIVQVRDELVLEVPEAELALVKEKLLTAGLLAYCVKGEGLSLLIFAHP